MAGAAFDHGANEKAPARLRGVAVGRPVKLGLRTGETLVGRYQGTALLDSSSYSSQVAAWDPRGAAAVHLPAMGESTWLDLGRGLLMRGHFGGLTDAGVRLRRLEADTFVTIAYGDFAMLFDADSQATAAGELRRSVDGGRLPMVSVARVGVEGGSVREVPWMDIARVDAAAPRRAKIVLGLVGLAVDLGLGIYLATAHWD